MNFLSNNIFQKIFKVFKNNANLDYSVFGLDIGTSSAKVVQLKRRNNKAIIETYGVIALGPYDDKPVSEIVNLSNEKTALAINDLFRESRITAKKGAMSISSESSLVFLIEIPIDVPESSYSTVVSTEARKYIPVSLSEVVLDYFPVPQFEESKIRTIKKDLNPNATNRPKKYILVAAIHVDVINKYKEIARIANLDYDFLEVEAFSAIRSTFNNENSAILLIDFGASKTKVCIVEHGIIRTLHIVGRGGKHITASLSKALEISFVEAENKKRMFNFEDKSDLVTYDTVKLSIDLILQEISVVIANYVRTFDKSLEKVILVGGGSLLNGLDKKIKQDLNIEVIYGNPFSKIIVPSFMEKTTKDIGPEFSQAVGLAIRQLQ